MKKSIILGIFLVNIHSLSAQKLVPTDFSFRSMAAVNIDSTINNMRSNIVTEIILQTNSTVWLGTGLGVSIIRDSLTVETLPSSPELIEGSPDTLLPEGGISAMDILADNKTMVAIAGSKNDMPIGKGLALTTNATDGVISWLYYRQPIDLQSQDTIDWAGGRYNFACLPITVTQANVTYDIALSDEYAWIASWAGGLRRNNFAGSGWKRVPLPMDDQFKLNTCEDSSYTTVINKEFSPDQPEYSKNVLKDYELNPRDPADEGNHNHKTFSVLVYGDTIWVGTANGINRGIIDADGFDCIDWEHYSCLLYTSPSPRDS